MYFKTPTNHAIHITWDTSLNSPPGSQFFEVIRGSTTASQDLDIYIGPVLIEVSREIK